MQTEPTQEHRWLEQLVGEWTYESEMPGAPGEPPTTFGGRETVRSIGGLWVVGESQGNMPGGTTTTMIVTLGYDPLKRRYVGTFVGSMMPTFWVYEGQVDASGRALVLDTEGPSFTDESRIAKYQDTMELLSRDRRVLRSTVQGEDGQWRQIMEMHYTRVK
jgi:hypothetical protein